MIVVFAVLAQAWGAPDTDPAACATCHPAEHAQWLGSRHAVASTNAIFTVAWERWPNGWCLTCHAPSVDQQVARLGRPAAAGVLHTLPAEPPGERWSHGVDCAACHLRGDSLISAGEPSSLARSMHPVRYDASLASEVLCATCHEFTFQLHTPRWPFTYGETPAQSTVSEWRTSSAAAAGQTCQSCHMPASSHRFPGAHDQQLVRGALQARVEAAPDGTITAHLSAPNAPHAVPTGDPFRRVVLEVCADASCTVVVAKHTLRRVFQVGLTTWELLEDRTLPPARPGQPSAQSVRLVPTGPAGWWRLSYRFGDARLETALNPADIGYLIADGPVTLLHSDTAPEAP